MRGVIVLMGIIQKTLCVLLKQTKTALLYPASDNVVVSFSLFKHDICLEALNIMRDGNKYNALLYESSYKYIIRCEKCQSAISTKLSKKFATLYDKVNTR